MSHLQVEEIGNPSFQDLDESQTVFGKDVQELKYRIRRDSRVEGR